ncbi:MAG: patatin-like phospholipase family protein [Betaproteobacteria bacterium]|nr:patatin-like phospholipase family protein [Betaproteobacteria bacterium]
MIFNRSLSLLFACAAFGFAATFANAQSDSAQPAGSKPRPKIGLVLSGGGARGAAQVGVIKVLEELRIPIDYIAGSSMGALVGAAYASGTSAAELEDRLRGEDWDRLLTDESPRSDRSFLRKEEDQNRLLRLELGVKDGSLRLPPGAISGQKFDILFSQITRSVSPGVIFDDLPIPFRAVATNAESGRMVVFDRGRLTDVMRASMSVPGAIAPYQIGDQIYLDGGLTRNLPVDIARAMGADVVIVVNIGTPLLKKNDIQSLVGVSLQMVNILTEQNVRTSIESMTKDDFLISPPLETIGATDFSLVGDAITIGAATTRGMANALSRLSLSASDFAVFRATQLARAATQTGTNERLNELRITGLERANSDELKRTLGIKTGEDIDFKKINMGISRAFGTGYFERINYSLLNDGGHNVLTVDAREKQWGPNYLRFGLTLSADTQGEGRFNLLMRYLRTQVNSFGAEWRNDFQLGRDRRFASQFFQPLGATGLLNAFSISPGVEFSKRPFDFYTNGQRVAQSLLTTNATALDIGYDLSRNSILRLGAVQSTNTSALSIGISQFPEQRFNEGGLRFKLLYDSLDDANFPKEGRTLQVDYYASLPSLRADNEFRKAELNYQDHLSFGSNTFSLATRYGRALKGGLSALNQYSMGGFLNLSAYRPGELLGQAAVFGRVSYYRRLGQFSNPFGRSMYAGLSAEFAKISDVPDQLWKSGTKNSFAAFVGVDTLIGPLYVGYGRARDRNSIFYLFLGQP